VRAEQITQPISFHGEGPFWDPRSAKMHLVDMLAGVIVELDGEIPVRHEVGSVAAAVRARKSGGYVVAVERGFRLLDAHFRPEGEVIAAFTDPEIRMNEGGCDPQGRFYCGSMAYSADAGRGTLYRIDDDLSVHTVLGDVTISNGLQWSADGSRVYHVDTPTGRIDVLDFDGDTGAMTNRRPFIEIDGEGNPDGLAIDEEDGLWVALYGGSAVRHYDRGGVLVDTVELPVTNVTACAFGGDDLRTLYITTSREGLDDGDQPEAGALFSVHTSVAGASQHEFSG